MGKQITRGEKATLGVFWKRFEAGDEEAGEEAEPQRGQVRMMGRAFFLFNACQPEGYESPEVPTLPTHQRIENAEAFFASLGADIRHGGSRAFYVPSRDYIQMPPFPAFVDPIAYLRDACP